MTPKHRKRFLLLFVVLITFLTVGQTVHACDCPDEDRSILGKFESSRFVVVNRIISVNKEPGVQTVYRGTEEIQEPIMRITSVTTIVEKVYKGNLKVGDEMIFKQGGYEDCFVEFDQDEVGAEFLFYLKPGEKRPRLWTANECERTKPLPHYQTRLIEDAADELLYLDKMNEVRGKTRISGTLISYQWTIARGNADFTRVVGRKVQIVGNGKTYEAITNEDGVYEIYDLPVGTYEIRPEGKQGWKTDMTSVFGGLTTGRYKLGGSALVPLKAGRHAEADFKFQVDNRLSGKVLDRSGRPMPRVHLRLLPTQPNVSEYFKRDASTDADGRFEIGEIPFASYVVVINDQDKISSYQPFRRFYYPDVTDREKAQIVTIVEGVTEYPLDIHVPAATEFVTVTGRVLTADNKPVVYAHVVFNSEKTDPTIEGSAFATTDEQGNFSLNVLKDLQGELFAVATLEPKEFKKCPALLRVNDEISLNRKTEAIRIQADGPQDGVDFRFDFSSCNRKKVDGRLLRVD
ncbi:MAG TPA: carboxypeptidase-like regulatory domain-containing protein [Pyrinomonadaceae bacterium]